MYTISKQFTFSAAHALTHLKPDHPCYRLHGHNYTVEVVLESEGLIDGFVQDYRSLDSIKDWIDTRMDHRNLNDVFGVDILGGSLWVTTAENIARILFERWKPHYPLLVAVRVSETPKTWAEYRP